MSTSPRTARTSLSMTPRSVRMSRVTFVNPRGRNTWKRLIDMPKVDCLEIATMEMYIMVVEGAKFLCRIMKYLVQTGITPQFIINKLTDVADAEDEDKAEVRRKVTDFIRKIIAGAFAVRTCDYFRVAPPQRDDYLHIDPISLTCAVIDRARTFGVMLSLNKIGLQMPASLAGIWETKLQSSMSSGAQLENNIKSLDPADRDNARYHMKAIENDPERNPTKRRRSG